MKASRGPAPHPVEGRSRNLPLLSVLLLALACAPGTQPPPPGADAGEGDPPPASAPEPTPDPEASGTGWVLRPTGTSELRIGMSLAELLPHLDAGVDTLALGGDCHYVPAPGAPDGIGLMVEGRRLVRIDVRRGDTRTVEGARVGDTEDHILRLHPDALRLPHKYVDGHYYLIATPGAPADTLHRYVFETDGRQVTTYRVGVYPPVEYVEGCS